MTAVRLYENLRTVSYAPFYLAEALGCYRAQGLEVEVVTSPDPTETAEGLIAGRVDVSWGGPMRVLLHHDRDPGCPLVCFCQVVARDPFVLVGRQPNPSFRFSDLVGAEVGVVAEVPTPWMTFQDDLRRAGVDPGAVVRGPDRTMAENVAALHDGSLDVAQLMEPYVELATGDGKGVVWHEFAVRGPIGFTTFYTTREYRDRHPDVCTALTRAMTTAVEEVYRRDGDAIARTIAHWFPSLSLAALARAIDRYRRSELWARDPSFPVSHFARLKAALLSGELISRDIPYEAVVSDVRAPAGGGDRTP